MNEHVGSGGGAGLRDLRRGHLGDGGGGGGGGGFRRDAEGHIERAALPAGVVGDDAQIVITGRVIQHVQGDAVGRADFVRQISAIDEEGDVDDRRLADEIEREVTVGAEGVASGFRPLTRMRGGSATTMKLSWKVPLRPLAVVALTTSALAPGANCCGSSV